MDIFYWDFVQDIKKAQEIIRKNAIVAGETDTVIGLFGNCTPEACQALNRIKKRNLKSYILLSASQKKATLLVAPQAHITFLQLASLLWPGAYTLVVPAAKEYTFATSPDGTVAIRVPQEEKILEFLSVFDAVFSTSANISGESVPTSFDMINPDIFEHVAAFIQFKQKRAQKPPSTIIKLEDHTLSIIRGTIEKSIWKKLIKAGFIQNKS